MAGILPVARAVYLCRKVQQGERANLGGVFNVLYSDDFPFFAETFFGFFQLAGGFGEMTVHLDVRRADDGRLVHSTARPALRFPDRGQLVQVSAGVREARFDHPGMYFVELFCDNVWVADTTLEIREQ